MTPVGPPYRIGLLICPTCGRQKHHNRDLNDNLCHGLHWVSTDPGNWDHAPAEFVAVNYVREDGGDGRHPAGVPLDMVLRALRSEQMYDYLQQDDKRASAVEDAAEFLERTFDDAPTA